MTGIVKKIAQTASKFFLLVYSKLKIKPNPVILFKRLDNKRWHHPLSVTLTEVDEEHEMTDRQPPVEINQASMDALTTVNGIGENLAKRIIENRPFQAIHDLVKVPGISEKKLAALMPHLTLGSEPSSQKITKKKKTGPEPIEEPITKLGETEAFVFLEDRNERQDALLIIFGGFILGMVILLLRRANK